MGTVAIMGDDVGHSGSGADPVWVWGLPLAPLTMAQSLDAIAKLITERTPQFVITANLNYAMVSESEPRLQAVNDQASIILADGMPLVWASRAHSRRLPERVAGSDLLFALCERAALEGWRIYMVGGADGVADTAADNLRKRYNGLQIVGIDVPPFRPPTAAEHAELVGRVRAAQPDILLVAFGQPKGEYWIADHRQELGVPVSIQVGASLDFAAGRIRRAPKWVQSAGMEWLYRIYQEPRRLVGRYLRNIWFVVRMIARPIVGKRPPRR